jgi:hypothetical protein
LRNNNKEFYSILISKTNSYIKLTMPCISK